MTVLHVSPEGGGDGSTVDSPTTLQGALDTLGWVTYPSRAWTVRLAPGVYRGAYRLSGVVSADRVTVAGPDMGGGEPTAVFDGSAGDSIGLLVVGANVAVRDVKFTNYNPGTATGVGLQAQDGADVWCINVHADNCSFVGIYASARTRLRVTGGTVTNCQRGIRAYNLVSFSLGYNGRNQRTTIRGCGIGFEARDLSAGRLDYTDIDSCGTGAWVYQGARVHPVYCTVSNSETVAVHASSGGWWYDDPNAPTTYTGNTRRMSTGAGSSELSWGGYPSPVLADQALDTVTHTGATPETVVHRMRPIPGAWMAEPGAQLHYKMSGKFDGPGDKTIGIRVNGTLIGAFRSSPGSLRHFTVTCREIAVTGNTQKTLWEATEDGGARVFCYTFTQAIPFPALGSASVNIVGELTDPAGAIRVDAAQYAYQPGTHAWFV